MGSWTDLAEDWEQVECFFELGSQPSGYIKCGKFLD